MTGASISAVLAVFFGVLLLPVLFVPYVAWSYRRRSTLGLGHALITVAAIVYAMALWTYTILPLPDAATMVCAAGGAGTQLVPFGSLGDIDLAANGLRDPALLQLVANVALFVPFGMLARHLFRPRRVWWVLVAGAGVSLLIELTQLTGVWGVYPCAYRVFDVDDLITNTVGTGIGILLAPVLRFVPGQEVLPSDEPRVVRPARRLIGMGVDLVTVTVSSFFVYVAIAVVGQEAGWFPGGAPLGLLSGSVTLGCALVVNLGVPWFARGATLGQLLTLVRPVDKHGRPPGPRAKLVRWIAGSGGWFTLVAIDAFTGQDAWQLLANAWLVLAALVVVVRHPRGVSGYLAGLTVADARDPLAAGTVADEVDPRRLGLGVVALVAALYLGGTAIMAIGSLAPWVGAGLALAGIGTLALASLAVVPMLVANGVIMVRREGVALSTLLPLVAVAGLVGLFVLCVVAAVSGWLWLLALSVGVLAVTAYLGFLFLAFLLYGQWYARRKPSVRADVVVVLGSRVFGDRVPPLLAARIDRGVEVLNGHLAEDPGADIVLVCSGGKGSDEVLPEGEAMARYAVGHGADASRVLAETRSRTTEENLTFSQDLLRERGSGTSLVVATNDFHAFRAAIIARELGIDAQVVGARTAAYYFPSAILREFVAVLSRSALLHALVALALAGLVGGLVLLLGT